MSWRLQVKKKVSVHSLRELLRLKITALYHFQKLFHRVVQHEYRERKLSSTGYDTTREVAKRSANTH